MKFNLRSQTEQGIVAVKTQFQEVRTRLKAIFQAVKSQIQTFAEDQFRWIRLQISELTKLSPQSTLLKLVAVVAAALMIGIAIGGVQFFLSNNFFSDAKTAADTATTTSKPKSANWGDLPPVPRSGQPVKPTPSSKTASPSALAEAPTQSQPATATQSSAKSSPEAISPKTATKAPPSPAPQTPQPLSPVPPALLTQSNGEYIPPQVSAPADPSNYGDRYAKDIFGNPVHNDPLIVLHETVGSADSAINMFRTAHSDESLQASYHSIIRRDGTIVYLVPSEKRAFGAGNSVFVSNKGQEAVRTHKQFPPSVNNFAYHISLESPPDGDNMAETHSGYTEAQYHSLAWLIAHSSVPDERITTHREIDRSESRIDPRSFDREKFLSYLHSLPRPYLN